MHEDSNSIVVNEYVDAVGNAFIEHLNHQDIKRLEQDICGVFSNYSYATDCEKLELEEALSILVERCLGTRCYLTRQVQRKEDVSSKVLDREQKLDVILRSVSRLQPLMITVNAALEHIARMITVSEYNGLEMDEGDLDGFNILKNYPELKKGLQKYVWATLSCLADSDSEYYLPDILEIVKGTEHEKLFSKEHIEDYLDGIDNRGLDDVDVRGLHVFRESSHVWGLVEKQSPNIICVRTPAIDPSWDQGQTEYSPYYRFEHSNEKNFLVIDFSYGVDADDITQGNIDSSWVQGEIDTFLTYQYVLLAHAAEVLMGHRHGETTQDQNWVDKQKQWLLPVLMSDISALEQQMKSAGIPIPQLPPVAHYSYGHSQGAGGINWAAHKGMRP